MSRKSRTKSKTRANAKTRTKKAVTATAKNTDTEKTTISTVENTDEKTTAVKAVKKTEEKQIVPTVKKTEEKKADIPTVKDTEEKKAAASTEKKAAKKKKAVSTVKKEDTKKETVPVEQEVVAKQEAPVEQEQPKEYVDLGPRSYPFVKTGGLGDVMSALPKSLAKLNVDVKVILPRYKCIPWEYQEKMEYKGSFYMNLCSDGKQYYVGIMEYQEDGVVYDFIDNDEFFSWGNPYTNLIDVIFPRQHWRHLIIWIGFQMLYIAMTGRQLWCHCI